MQIDIDEFSDEFSKVLDCYPRFNPSKDRRARLTSEYFARIRLFSRHDILEAIDAIPEGFPAALPTVGEFKNFIKGRSRKAEKQTIGLQRGEMSERCKEEAIEDREKLPRHHSDQARYVSEADTEVERIARTWEIEDLNSGRVPWCDTPVEIGKQRLAVIQMLLRPLMERAL